MEDNFILDILGSLEQNESKKQINSDIKQLEKTINMLRITGTFAKGNTKKELNAYIKSLQSQLNYVKLTAKIDSKNVKREIDNALHGMKFKDIDALNIDENKAKLKARKVIADVKALAEGSPITVNLEYRKNKLNNDLTTYLNKNTKITESSILLKESEKIRKLIDAIDDKKSLTDATDAFRLFKSEVSATGFTSKSTADKIKSMLGHITKIGSAFGVASMAINNFVKSLQTLRSNDTILTEISKTSEMTKQQLKELGDEAFKTASKYGQLSSNYLLAVQEMARSGYEDTSKELGKLSLLAQSAGDMTADSANNYLLATDAAYKYSGSIEKLNAALDGANYISNKNSATLTNIADATRVSASFAANAGVAIDELTAAEATMIAVTKRSGSEIGRAFRSIILNLQGVSGEFDGEVIDEEQLKKVEARCHSLGVELEYMKDGMATLRNPMEVLKDLADVYNSLPDNSAEKQGLISDLGGKFHANALSSLLSRWDMYEKMLEEFSQGTGSALEEAEKTANSWEGRLAALQNSWDSFINTLTNKEAIMNGISLFDRMIQGAESFVDTFGTIPTVLTTINTSIVAMHKDYGLTKVWDKETGKIDLEGNIFGIDFSALKNQKKHFEEAEGAILHWNEKLSSSKADLELFNAEVVKNNAQLKEYLATCSKDAPGSLSGYQQYLQSTGQATEGLRLKTLLLNTALTMLGGIAVQLIVTGIQKTWDTLNVTVEEQEQKINELKSSYEGLKSEYDELSQKQDVTDAEKRRLEYLERRLELDERILKAEQAQLFDEKTGNKFTDLFDKDNLQTQYLEERNHNNKNSFFNLSRMYESNTNDIDDIHERIARLKELQATIEEGSDQWQYYQNSIDAALNQETKYIDKLSESENQLTINLGKYADNIEYLQSQLDTGELTEDQTATAKEQLKVWQNLYDETDAMITQIQKLNGTYDDTADRVARKYSAELNKAKTYLGGYDYSNTGASSTNETGRQISDFWNENVLSGTEEEIEQNVILWEKVTDGITDATKAMDAYTEAKKNANAETLSDDIASTIPTISSSVQQLATQLEPQFAKLGEAYKAIFTENGFTLDDVDNSMLEDLRKSFAEIEEEIGVAFDASTLDPFFDTLTDSSSTADQVQQAFNDLATAYFYSTDTLEQLNEETAEAIAKQLEEMGVVNAEEVVYDELNAKTEALTLQKQILADTGIDVMNASNDVVEGLLNEAGASETARLYLFNLVAQEQVFNAQGLSTEGKVAQLKELASAYGQTAVAAKIASMEGEYTKSHQPINYEEIAKAAQAEINSAINNVHVDFKGVGSGKKSGGSSGTKSSKDLHKEAYEQELKELEHMHELGLISDEEYWKARMDLNEKYFGESSGMHEKYLEEYQDNEEEILKGIKDLWKDYYDDRKNDLKDLISYAEKLYDREIDSLEEDIEQIEEKRDTEKKYWQGRIDAIGDEIDALEDANDQRERAIDLQNKQYQLQRAMHQRTILLYSESKGMHYVNDTKAERDAKNDLDDAENDNKVADLKKQQKDLEKQLDAILETYDAQIESIERQIDSLKKMKSAWSEIVENQEFKELEDRLQNIFGDGLRDKILSGNTDFINSVTSQYSNASDMLRMIEDATLADIQNMVAQYGVLPENLSPITGVISDITNVLGNVDTSNFNANINNTAQASANAAEKMQGVTTALNNLSNEVSNYQMPTLDTDNFISAFTEDGGILSALNGFMERYKEICDGIPEIWNNSLAEAFGQGGGNGDPLAGGIANDTKYDALFNPIIEALDNCKANIEAKLQECLGTFTSFQTDLSGVIGVGGISEDSGASQYGTQGKSGKASGSEKQSESGGGSDTIVGALQEGGELIDQSLNGEEDSWSASFITAQESIHESATSIVECIESMVETIVNACIKAIEAINMLASADENNSNNPTPSPYIRIGHAHSEGGNAHVEGTAKVTGDWAVQSNENKALVGEVGRELIVRNGKYFTVGDNGAEMFQIQKGDIVFNHEQTESLLKNGQISGHGKAYADGTVGGGKFVLADGTVLTPVPYDDPIYDVTRKFEAYMKKTGDNIDIIAQSGLIKYNREMGEVVKSVTNVNNVTNNSRNMQQPIHNEIHVTLPNVTNATSAESLLRDLESIGRKKYQVNW